MHVLQSIAEMRSARRGLSGTVAFVPTLGALHRGHLALIEAALQQAEHVIVSIFVNPTQFAAHEDYDRYPRPVDDDLARCREIGVHGVFMPATSEMYPPGRIACELNVPDLAAILEGEYRPTHFAGVCRVVAKLINIVQPDIAVFGLKDYQQYRIVQTFVADLNIPTRIIAHPTIREPDGLAMSSRNVYLTAEQRPHALGLYKALLEAKLLVEESGETDPQAVERAMTNTLTAHHVDLDYAVIRHPQTLAPLDSISPSLTDGVVALVAGHVGAVRLIDNMVLTR